MRDKVYLGLVHYPVYNKRKEVVSTSVTNFDIHDISRTCKTYDVAGYHIIVPVEAQKALTNRIVNYWKEGIGGDHNQDRVDAFSTTYVTDSISETMDQIESETGKRPLIVTTSAKTFPNSISYAELGPKIQEDDNTYLLLFGTGHGLTDEIMDLSTYILDPIRGEARYNHLSVRSAVSIILDRLFGDK